MREDCDVVKSVRPPRFLRWCLQRALPRPDRRFLSEELDLLFAQRHGRDGAARATAWYVSTVLSFVVRMGGGGFGDQLREGWDDSRSASRILRRRPRYAVASIVTLGLGLGGLATVFAIANWLLIRPIPGVQGADELFTMRLGSNESPIPSWPISNPDLHALREGMRSVTQLEAFSSRDLNVAFEDGATPVRATGQFVTPGWFSVLGLNPSSGRFIAASEDPATHGIGEVVVSSRFASGVGPTPAEAVGRTLLVNGNRFAIVGVAPEGFRGPELPGSTDLWFGQSALAQVDRSWSNDAFEVGWSGVWEMMIGAPAIEEVRAEELVEEANGVIAFLRESQSASAMTAALIFTHQVFPGLGLDPTVRDSVRRTLRILLLGGIFLLALAIANVANLTLAHTASERGNRAIRSAMGASRRRLFRQILTEHLYIGLLGGGVACGIAFLASRVLRGVRLDELGASLADFTVDGRVLLTVLAVGAVAGLASGAGPAWVASGDRALRGIAKTRAGSGRSDRVRSFLVGAQMALSVVLLVGGGLTTRTVLHLGGFDFGIDPEGLVSFRIDVSDRAETLPARAEVLTRIGRSIEETGGVVEAGFAFPEPIRSSFLTYFLGPQGGDENSGTLLSQLRISHDFIEAAGLELLAGRPFGVDDHRPPDEGSQPVVILTESALQALMPGRPPLSAVGMFVQVPRRPENPIRIVGVVSDLRGTGPTFEGSPVVFLPWGQTSFDGAAVGWVRVPGASNGSVAETIRSGVAAVDPNLPVFDVRTVRGQMNRLMSEQRVIGGLAFTMAVLGLVLSAVGLYGVLGYAVARRRHEIGVRRALGENDRSVLGRVFRRGIGLAGLGLVPGLFVAYLTGRVLESILYGVTPLDPVSFTASIILLLGVAAVASWVPARSAAAVSPVEALRVEG